MVRLVRASPHLSRPIPLMRAAISHFRVILGSRNTLNSGGAVFDHHCFGLVFFIFFHFAIPLLAACLVLAKAICDPLLAA